MHRAARQVALQQIGETGQANIAGSTALIIGLGGIGCATASYLAAAGVGQLLLCDFDTVDESNLGRQTLYGPADVGHYKAVRAASRLAMMNPEVSLTEIPERLSDSAMAEAIDQSDIVLDGCDNFSTRFQVNDAAVIQSTRLISGSAIRFEGQLTVFGADYDRSPCYRCLYQEADESLDDCTGNGVLGPVPGVVGCMMATEALKSLAGLATQTGRLQIFDALASEWRSIAIRKKKKCPVCCKS